MGSNGTNAETISGAVMLLNYDNVERSLGADC